MKRVSILLLGFLALVKASPIPQSGSPASVSNQQFGAGAAAGVGGLGRSAGIGSFQANPGTAPYLPFGAFAGLGQGSDKLGAGCSGLNCGVQVGDFVLNTRQLFDAFLNSRNPNGNENNAGFQRTRFLPTATPVISPFSSIAPLTLSKRSFLPKPTRAAYAVTNRVDDDLHTSETLSSGFSIFDRMGTAQNFLSDIIRAILGMLTSLFSGNGSVSRNTSTLLATTTPTLGGGFVDARNGIGSPASNSDNQTFYRITLGPTTPKPGS